MSYLLRYGVILTLLLASYHSYAAETLSPNGAVLTHLVVDPTAASVTKTITVSGDIQASYAVMQLNSGEFLQRAADGGYVPWDGEIDSLLDNQLSVSGNSLTFPLLSGDLSSFELPLTLYVGVLDADSTLQYGFFELREGFTPIQAGAWTATAVRKVLHTFAYGGHATDEQIQTWASLPPATAIQQILTVDTTNLALSPSESGDDLANVDGSLRGLSEFWSGTEANNPVENSNRDEYDLRSRRAPSKIWQEAVTRRGLNPVRQKIGLFETNYHMAVNQSGEVGVNNVQIVRYYDDIMDSIANNDPYQDTLALAATSAAVAAQYNHRYNVFNNDTEVFRGNEDFAREYHQLFFGVLGDYDLDYHEEVTIKNTAKALTDMDIPLDGGAPGEVCEFGTEQHHQADLEIMFLTISGETALEKMTALAQESIVHPESEENLPVIIVRNLADDNLDADKKRILRNVWASQETKQLMAFLQQYAISTMFHSSERVKYFSSIDRHLLVMNQLILTNEESYRDLYDTDAFVPESGAIFSPRHDVFGGQTGVEASTDAEVFRAVYDRSTQQATQQNQAVLNETGQVEWTKDWRSVLPADSDGVYRVQTLAESLWQRFIADGLRNFGDLERLHVYSLIATGFDPAYNLDPNNPTRVLTVADITGGDPGAQAAYAGYATTPVALDSSDETSLIEANRRIGQAVNFIIATPFIFAQEGQ